MKVVAFEDEEARPWPFGGKAPHKQYPTPTLSAGSGTDVWSLGLKVRVERVRLRAWGLGLSVDSPKGSQKNGPPTKQTNPLLH